MPEYTKCMCIVCWNSGEQTEARIRNSYASDPVDPESDEYGAKPTSYNPGELKGGIG